MKPLADLLFFQLYSDCSHITEEGVEIGHLNIHATQPLVEVLVLGVELGPIGAQRCEGGMVLDKAAGMYVCVFMCMCVCACVHRIS